MVVVISCMMEWRLRVYKNLRFIGHQKCFYYWVKLLQKSTIYDYHDHGRFQAKFDPRGRQMVVMVADPPPSYTANFRKFDGGTNFCRGPVDHWSEQSEEFLYVFEPVQINSTFFI